MKTTDSDVGKYLEMFTLLKSDQVKEIMNEHQVQNMLYFVIKRDSHIIYNRNHQSLDLHKLHWLMRQQNLFMDVKYSYTCNKKKKTKTK